MELKEEYKKALITINNDFYEYNDLTNVVEALIIEYLLRENGRLGKIENGIFQSF